MTHLSQTWSLLRSNGSRGSQSCTKMISNSLSDCTSSSVMSRRGTSHNTKISTTGHTPSSIFRTKLTTTGESVSPSSRPILSVLAWSVMLSLISSGLGKADSRALTEDALGRRDFVQLQCQGVYNQSNFVRLERICENCYKLFNESTLHPFCRRSCFTSERFKGCVEVLLLQDEMDQIKTWVKQLNVVDPGV